MSAQPGVCVGWLRHRRSVPVPHAFTYPLFMVLLDVDRIPELMRVSRFTSHNRWNWASFHDQDHLAEHTGSTRERIAADAARHGVTLPDGPIFLLTHLRYLGYGFNPVSFFYCFDRTGRLCRILAEVNNTFGGAHNYWLDPADSAPSDDHPVPFVATARKAFYVSPFMEGGLDYGFRFTRPRGRFVAHMTANRQAEGREPFFDATLSLEHRPWTATQIRRALIRHPVMTAKVVAGIHWEAWRLWRKGVPVVPRHDARGMRLGPEESDLTGAVNER